MNRPSFSSPAAIWSTPTRMTIKTRAPTRWSAGTVVSACPAVSDAAAVVVITIMRVLDSSPPTKGPTMAA